MHCVMYLLNFCGECMCSSYPNTLSVNRYYVLIVMMISCLSLGSCQRTQSNEQSVPAHSPQALEQLIKTLQSTAVRSVKDARGSLKKHMFTSPQLANLLVDGSQRAELIQAFITEQSAVALKEVPWALRAAYEAGMKEVVVTRVGPNMGGKNAPGDLLLLQNLTQRSGLYTVRVQNEDGSKKLRISGWLYLPKQGWKTLLKLGELLEGAPHE